ncbi:EF-hand domain-containing family member B-like [Belonocnema kinseyi]|uniref:EF-hand domain-containing family member B-like n=1 Tax=Belonocnema kinseyi TaxID=2817044 RepID=UPI00143D04F1|nr:EF-hand domain-containing family member B-like [Belonocnema kinseyi]
MPSKHFYSESTDKKTPRDTLKPTLKINKDSEKALRKLETAKGISKDKGSVKDCLRSKESTPFQLLMAELKNTNINGHCNNEVGRTRYPVPNLPAEIDPQNMTFGQIRKPDGTVAEAINPIVDLNFDTEKDSAEHRMYLKSHKDYYPSEQINRAYEIPFNKFNRFGKPTGGSWEGKRIKKLMHWINTDPVSKVSCLQADFYNYAQPRVGEIKNAKVASLLINCTFGERSDKKHLGVSETLKECLPINPQLSIVTKYLEDVNKLRNILKKRRILFSHVEQELNNLDKENLSLVNINELFAVLTKFRVFPKRQFFCELLKMLKISENDRVNYKEAINLLNWKCDFPEIPKLEVLESNYYLTTYNDTIGNIQTNPDSVKECIKESPGKNLQSNIGEIITPNIFTQYGLSNEDLLKPLSKQKVLSILEKIEEIPKEKLESIWDEGLKVDGTDGVCISAIKSLLDTFIAEMDINI